MNSEDLKHPELILNRYRVNLLNKLKLTSIMIICREVLWILYIIFLIFSLPRNFESILVIFNWIIYGLIILFISYYDIPRLLDCKLVLNNISILKNQPLYLSKITETIFLLYRRLHREKRQIKDLQIKQDHSLFISFFEEKIKQERMTIMIWIMAILSLISIFSISSSLTKIDLVLITYLGLLILLNLKITQYSKSWLDSYSNLSHWNDFFSNYEITPKMKELNLLERDFQQFEIKNSNQGIKCSVCGMYNEPNSNYCDSCGNELKKRGNRN